MKDNAHERNLPVVSDTIPSPRKTLALYSSSQRVLYLVVFFFKQKTAYEILRSDWSSDVCLPISGVGFFDYDSYLEEKRARDAQLSGGAIPAPDAVSSEPLDSSGRTVSDNDAEAIAAE